MTWLARSMPLRVSPNVGRLQDVLERLMPSAGVGALVIASVVMALGTTSSGALFSDAHQRVESLGASRIFPGSRSTSAFSVVDASGGSAADRSSAFADAADGRTVTTGAWSAAFASGRYLQFDLNSPLPAGLASGGMTFRLRFAGTSPTGTTCVYVDVRRASDNGVLATYGSSGNPLGCATGAGFASIAQSIPVVGSTDLANDLRVRVYGRDSSAAASVLDEATVTGSTAYAGFTLFPVRFTDAASGSATTIPWELQGP